MRMKTAKMATQPSTARIIYPKPIRRENKTLATRTKAPIANTRFMDWSSVISKSLLQAHHKRDLYYPAISSKDAYNPSICPYVLASSVAGSQTLSDRESFEGVRASGVVSPAKHRPRIYRSPCNCAACPATPRQNPSHSILSSIHARTAVRQK